MADPIKVVTSGLQAPSSATKAHRHDVNLTAVVDPIMAYITDLQTRVAALEGEPPTDIPGWRLVFEDQFTTWDPSRYFKYGSSADGAGGWKDTSQNGTYDPSIISSDGSKLRIHLHTANGVRKVAAFCPRIPGSLSGRGDMLGMRVEFRIRADLMPGFKGVPLTWPLSGRGPYTYDTNGNPSMEDGEHDIYESLFTLQPKAFTHHQGAIVGNDQDYFFTPVGTKWQDWHTVTFEWKPGVYANYWCDGVPYTPQDAGSTTDRIPNTAHHLVMQFETDTNVRMPPDPSVSGYVEIEYLKVWALA